MFKVTVSWFLNENLLDHAASTGSWEISKRNLDRKNKCFKQLCRKAVIFLDIRKIKQIFGDSHEVDFLRMIYSSNGETGFIF